LRKPKKAGRVATLKVHALNEMSAFSWEMFYFTVI